MPVNIEDPLQQEAFDRETLKLWNTTQHFDSFAFKTLQVRRFCKNIKFDYFLLINVIVFVQVNLSVFIQLIISMKGCA